MKCPFCAGEETKVVDSRDMSDGRSIRRRRECEKCVRRFTTYEEIESIKMLVVKRDGRKQDYDREKLRTGLARAFEKRPGAEEHIEKILGEVEYELHSGHCEEIPSRTIGNMTLAKIKDIDEVAYLRFASVYKGFGSASSFQKEIDKL